MKKKKTVVLGEFVEANDPFGHWFAGFADGEGSFSITKHKRHTDSYGCTFQIMIREDDKEILEEIQEWTGLGKIFRSVRTNGAKPQLAWCVQRKAECLKLVEIFDEYPLRAKKKKDFEIWREAVILHNAEYHTGVTTAYDWSPIAALKVALTEVRAYTPNEPELAPAAV